MNPAPQGSAAAASDAYRDRPADAVENKTNFAHFGGQKYSVFGYKDDPVTGFHATAYQNVATGEIIIAYRGTDPDWRNHARTTVQDAMVDLVMVKEQANTQKSAADAFTKAMIDKAQQLGISKDHIFLAGHSLGGTLVEIEAWEFGLRGITVNAFGAVDLEYGVPRGGGQVTNYVMAGDPVSAGSHHFGEVKVLASVEDVAALRAGRYLDAPAGTPPPNPMLSMRVSDHSVHHFTGEGGAENMLIPANLAAGEARYLRHKAAFDHFREDVRQDRAELGEALRSTESRTILTTGAQLSPRLQQQLSEMHALKVDVPIQQMVEHNPLMRATENTLDYTATALRSGGDRTRQNAEQVASEVRHDGQLVQQRAQDVARSSLGFSAINPLAAAGVALGAAVVGYTARADAEGVAQTSHFAGQATHALGEFAAERLQSEKHLLESEAHIAGQLTTDALHMTEFKLAVAIDTTLVAYQTAERALQLTGNGATLAYDTTRQAVLRDVEMAELVGKLASTTLASTSRRFESPPTLSDEAQSSAPKASPAPPSRATGSAQLQYDPRHPDSPNHALYNELHRRIPDASEKRLLQFTDACHSNKITVKNLGVIHLDEHAGRVMFTTSWPPQPPATVDIKTPSPEPQQSIRHIQQFDQQQIQQTGQRHAQNAQTNQQGQTQLAPQAPTR